MIIISSDLLKNKVEPFLKGIATLSFISLLFFSCQKELSNENGNLGSGSSTSGGYKIPNPWPVNGSVVGWIIDENSLPIENAQVTVVNNTYTTDANGYFKTNTLVLDKFITTVKVSKQGYFKGYRSFCANATKNYVKIKLIPKQLSNSFSSNSASTITLSNGTNISFLANSVVIKN